MVQLTDLLERQRVLAEEQARIQRDLGILNQIAELAAQLDEPHANGGVSVAERDERQKEPEAAAPAPATAEPETAAPPAPPPPPDRPAPPATDEPEAKRKGPSSGQRERLLKALHDLRGTALQIDLKKKSGLDSGTTSVVCRALEAEGVIRAAGKGGYMNKSTRWKLVEQPGTAARASGGHELSPRVRKAIERDAKKKGPTQPPTHEGRILSVLTISPGMTIPEIAAEVSIPASTVGRLVGKLKAEGEVIDADDRGHFRRVMS